MKDQKQEYSFSDTAKSDLQVKTFKEKKDQISEIITALKRWKYLSKHFFTRPSALIFELCKVNYGENMLAISLQKLISIFIDCRYLNLKE